MADLAAARFGVVTAADLRAAGLSSPAIARRVADGRLHRLHPGVYAAGHRWLVPEGRWLAAVLACGPGAALSHRSAAFALGLVEHGPPAVDVTAPGARGRGRRGIVRHHGRLTAEDVITHRGLPVTSVARTLLDLAEVVSRRELDRALEEAVRRSRLDARAMTGLIARSHGRRGLRPLRAALGELRPERARTRSELERRMLSLIDEHGLPRPEVNVRLAGFEVDLHWRAEALVVELDGHAHHGTRQAFERDRRRDAELQARGLRVQRFTWRQVTGDPAWVGRCLAALLHRA